MPDTSRSYTGSERRQRAWLVIRGAKQSAAAGRGGDYSTVDPRIEGRIERLDARAEDRAFREYTEAQRLVEQARNEAAAAKAKLRAARGPEKAAARTALRNAERRVRDTEKAASRFN